tara:strand:+ start:1407 stop:1868 length:462 start_codon:yes stop_codon:yes gene_type:complete
VIKKKTKMNKVKTGDKVKVHYVGRLMDGTEFDNSRNNKGGEGLDFTIGDGKLLKGFNEALLEMEVGQIKKITLKPEEAYGDVLVEAVQEIQNTEFPPEFELVEGEMVEGLTESGQPIRAKIKEIKTDSVILDMNHPLAGEELGFEIELMDVIK